jgi:signal transduction histidine kinase
MNMKPVTIRFISLMPIAAVALASVLFTFIFAAQYTQMQERLINARFEESTKSNALVIEHEVDQARHNVSRLKEAVTLFDTWEPQKAQEYLNGLMAETMRYQENEYTAWLALAPERARELFGTEGYLVTVRKDFQKRGTDQYGSPRDKIIDVWTDPQYQTNPKDIWYPLAQQSRDFVITPVYFDESYTHVWIISVLLGLYDGDRFQGLVAIDILWDDILKHVEKTVLGKTGGLLLVETHTGTILTKTREGTGRTLLEVREPFQESLYDKSGGRQAWEPILRGSNLAVVRAEGGDEFVVSSRRISSMPWTIVAYQSRAELREALYQRLALFLLLISGLLAFLCLGAWLAVRNLAAPLDKLVEVMKQVVRSPHVETLQAPVLGTVETRELGGIFNHMLRTIGETTREKEASYAKLEESHRTLEHKVEERTRELKTKNAHLELTLAQLTAAQEQLVAKEKLASLAALTAGIAHEIKNPLNFVNNFAELSVDLVMELRAGFEARQNNAGAPGPSFEELLQELEQNIQRISAHGKRADSIVRDMLLHSNTNAAEQQWTDLNALVETYVKLAHSSYRMTDSGFEVSIRKELDPSVGAVLLFPQDFGRALLNVINNGFYAMSQKRKLAKSAFCPELRVTSRHVQDSIEIRIRDNGLGIPSGIRDRIFNPFFTTKPAGSGTGLGLSITHEIIVQEHRGRIRVESEEGQYTEFALLIPAKGIAA